MLEKFMHVKTISKNKELTQLYEYILFPFWFLSTSLQTDRANDKITKRLSMIFSYLEQYTFKLDYFISKISSPPRNKRNPTRVMFNKIISVEFFADFDHCINNNFELCKSKKLNYRSKIWNRNIDCIESHLYSII